ncbi:hypothetical protein FMIA91_21610 [Fidelibacter multiformis]|jgi:hypothetical protein
MRTRNSVKRIIFTGVLKSPRGKFPKKYWITLPEIKRITDTKNAFLNTFKLPDWKPVIS